jgi:hypothetical protein
MHDQFPAFRIERTHHRDLARLARSGDPQIGATRSPGVCQIRMRQSFRFIGVEQHDVARSRLGLAQLQAQPNSVDRLSILLTVQRVPRPTPAKPPFSLSKMLKCDFEMRAPVWRSTCAHNRGSVQLVRFSTGWFSTALPTA